MGRPSTRSIASVLTFLVLGAAGHPPAWGAPAEDGRIAFRRYLNDAQTRGAIFTAESDGSDVRQLTNPGRGVITDEPEWSPNGRWIVFQVEEGDGHSRLFKIRPNGSDRTYLSRGCGSLCGDGYASWFPGGRRIAFERGSCGTGRTNLVAIYVMRFDGRRARRVTHRDATCANPHRFEDSAPTVSPSGERIAFERIDHDKGKEAIIVAHLDGTWHKRITPWRINAAQPTWSPNGRWIAFRTQEQSETKGNIALVHPNGRGLHRITHAHGSYKWLSCAFSPSGDEIIAGRAPGDGETDNADLFIMEIDGSNMRNVTNTLDSWESAPDWGPQRS